MRSSMVLSITFWPLTVTTTLSATAAGVLGFTSSVGLTTGAGTGLGSGLTTGSTTGSGFGSGLATGAGTSPRLVAGVASLPATALAVVTRTLALVVGAAGVDAGGT